MLKTPSSYQLLSSMATEIVNMNEVTRYILKLIYNRPEKELSPGESRYNMLLKRKASSKTFPSSEAFPPDEKSVYMKVLRATYVAYCTVNCLNNEYVPLNPSKFGWALVDDNWKPVWFEGNALPEVNKTVDSPENKYSEELTRKAKSVMTAILWSHLMTI